MSAVGDEPTPAPPLPPIWRGVTWALQRRDFHVFPTATNARDAGDLLAALEAFLTRGSGPAAPDHAIENHAIENHAIENRSTR